MINKQNLWFVTLFSLILILGIYYVSMGDEGLKSFESEVKESAQVSSDTSDVIVALRVASDEEILEAMQTYQEILLDDTATLEEKNDAYDALQALNSKKGEVEKLEKSIKEKFKFDNFVKIDSDSISIIISSNKHDEKIANNIIRHVQSLYDKKKYITVKFEA